MEIKVKVKVKRPEKVRNSLEGGGALGPSTEQIHFLSHSHSPLPPVSTIGHSQCD
jgi:hypothetical protein